jgi:alkylation response protein AidB-like acyl-CoA dehydrogenase
MADLGWVGLTLPEEFGGSGADLLDLYVIYQELGRALVPSPHLPSAVISAHVLLAGGSGDASALLPAIAEGRAIVVPAWIEPRSGNDSIGTDTTADVEGESIKINGTKLLVPFANSATHLLVSATEPGQTSASLFVVPRDRPGISLTSMPNIAGYPLFAIELGDVEVRPAERVGATGAADVLLGPALDRAAVLRAAEVVGAGEAALEMSVDYANQRKQFGRPIGAYQAVQYMCSTMAICTNLTDLFARRAAWHLDHGGGDGSEVAMARAYAAESAARIFREAHELHAGVAFMYEHDLQLFTRRAKHWEHDLGDVRVNRRAITDVLLG